MTAVLEAAYALGFMIGSPVAGVLMENFGWAVPFVLMAGIAVVFAIALGFILPKEEKNGSVSTQPFLTRCKRTRRKRLIFPQTFARTQG